MCATCGCSDGSEAKLTNMQTGESVALDEHGHSHSDHHHHHHHGHGHDHHHHDHGSGHHHSHNHGTTVSLERDVLDKNNRMASEVRNWLAARNILALNLVSSPGAGKTTLLERTIRDLGESLALSVVEGDQQTLNDAQRIQEAGCRRVVQINTGTACHLDAAMMSRALGQLDPPPGSVVMIENVGNLVCPALFDLGERAKVVVVSVTEGDDKPIKYPHMFRASEVMLLNKVDLLPHVRFDVDACVAHARRVNARIRIIAVSATRGDGLAEWYEWLHEQRVRPGAVEASGV
jgi:hydrogenase nickel incorporation protein HypB